MRQSKAIRLLVSAGFIAMLAITCLPSTPANAGGALVPGTAAYNVLAQKSQMFADQDWHLQAANTYCWYRSKPHFLYTYTYGATESFLVIEVIQTGSTSTWRWTPSTGWYQL